MLHRVVAAVSIGLIVGVATAQRVPQLFPQFGAARLDGASAHVNESVMYDDGTGQSLIVAGSFTSAGLTRASNIAKLSRTGQWSAMGAGLSGPVRALAVFNDGTGLKVYAGGTFDSLNSPGTGVRRWNGSTWENVGNGPDGPVNDLLVWNDGFASHLYACGTFMTSNGVATPRIAKWDGLTWTPVGMGAGSVTGGIANALAAWDSPTGQFLALGGYVNLMGVSGVAPVALWNGATWSRIAPLTTTSPVIGLGQLIKPTSRELWISTMDFSAPLRRWNGTTVSTVTGLGNFGLPQIRLLKQGRENNEDVMLIGGLLSITAGLNGIVKHNGTSASTIVPSNGSIFGEVTTAEYFSLQSDPVGTTRLFIGGNFSTVTQQSQGGLFSGPIVSTRTDRTGFATLAATLTNPGVRAVGYVGSDEFMSIIVGGYFGRGFVHTQMPYYLAKFDGANWVATTPGLSGGVESIVRLENGDVLLGGTFANTFETTPRTLSNLARYDGVNIWPVLRSGSASVGVEVSITNMLRTVESGNEVVYIALSTSTGPLRRYIGGATQTVANVNNSNILAMEYGETADASADALYAAGFITVTGGQSRVIGRLTPAGFVDVGGLNISGVGQALHIVREDITPQLTEGMIIMGGIFNVNFTNSTISSPVVVSNGGAWDTVGTNLTGQVNELFVLGGALYASGALTVQPVIAYPELKIGTGLARWNGEVWELVTNVSQQSGMTGTIHAYAFNPLDRNSAIIGGNFDRVDGYDAYGAVGLRVLRACAADYDEDGGVDGTDIGAFFADWANSESGADVNDDGGVDGGDVEVFFALWSAGGC